MIYGRDGPGCIRNDIGQVVWVLDTTQVNIGHLT